MSRLRSIVDLRKAYDSLHLLIRKVRHSARDLTGTSGEIARASLDLSQRTESAAAALEQQAATMEEIGSSVQAMADNSKDAAGSGPRERQRRAEGWRGYSRCGLCDERHQQFLAKDRRHHLGD